MPVKNNLVDEAFGRPLPNWVGELAEMTSANSAVSIAELAEFLNKKPVSIRSVLSTIIEPDYYEVINGTSRAMFKLTNLHKIGNQYLAGKRYRGKLKSEI